jgi:hypothetical protein
LGRIPVVLNGIDVRRHADGGAPVRSAIARDRVGIGDSDANGLRPIRRKRQVQHVGAVAADEIEVPVEIPVDKRVARPQAPTSFVARLDVAPREHDRDISALVPVPSLDGSRRETLASKTGFGENSPGHSGGLAKTQ